MKLSWATGALLLSLGEVQALPSSRTAKAAAGDPPYNVPEDTVLGALTCPYGSPYNQANAVLLVHGTGSTGNESWGRSYVPALHQAGYLPCYLTLPDRAMGDAQESAEYVARSVHHLSQLAEAPIALIGHSQGNLNIQWALRYWVSTRSPSVVRAYVALSPDFQGTAEFNVLDGVCEVVDGVPLCAPSEFQQRMGSNFIQALNSGSAQGPNRAYVPTTAVWTQFDEVVLPPGPNANLSGATVYPLQQLCPLRIVEHLSMTFDGAAFEIALDALNHGGEADLARVGSGVCSKPLAPGMDPTLLSLTEAIFNDLVVGVLLHGPKVKEEPPVASYAR